MKISREHSKRLSNLIRRGRELDLGQGQRGLIYSQCFFREECVYTLVVFVFLLEAGRETRHRGASNSSHSPGLLLCGRWVMEEGGLELGGEACKRKLEQQGC